MAPVYRLREELKISIDQGEDLILPKFSLVTIVHEGYVPKWIKQTKSKTVVKTEGQVYWRFDGEYCYTQLGMFYLPSEHLERV